MCPISPKSASPYPTRLLLIEVEILGDHIDRDAVRSNLVVLKDAAELLGLRVGVNTCTVHVKALYDYMQVPCPRCLG